MAISPHISTPHSCSMAPPISKSKSRTQQPSLSSQFLNINGDDDDFQDFPSPSFFTVPKKASQQSPTEKLKIRKSVNPGRQKCLFDVMEADLSGGLDSIEPTLDLLNPKRGSDYLDSRNSVESKLLKPYKEDKEKSCEDEFVVGTSELDVLLNLCDDVDEQDNGDNTIDSEEKCAGLISCPICGANISELSNGMRQVHTNECLDSVKDSNEFQVAANDLGENQCPGLVVDGSPNKFETSSVDVSRVVEWLRNLGLKKYEEIFIKQEIDWDALQWLTEEDLCSIGITMLGPRKKILHALRDTTNDLSRAVGPKASVSRVVIDETKPGTNKLITQYFSSPLSGSDRRRGPVANNCQNNSRQSKETYTRRNMERKDSLRNWKHKDAPLWCCVPGTPFRVDAFKYLRRDCSHWFLSHFHFDHYQGLTKSFCHGTIYCSLTTAKLVNLKIGIPWDKIQVLPLNQKINIAGIEVTCFDANHCPGAIIILFEPPNGKPVLHTGDFRFCGEMTQLSILKACSIHTLILDTTYCNPQYDFPKQEAIIQFVIEAIQAETFNPKTLFLIGSYTIGKERVFVEVAKILRKKIYVTIAKLRILECLGLQQEDMQWFTLNEQESHIHVVPMWSIASFKRLKHISDQYRWRFSLIVAFSPTGWSFAKGKKSTGKRWQKGTIIRYEVPYSEHSSFTELKEFVKFISPANIIPSVNNHGPDSHRSMVSQLLA